MKKGLIAIPIVLLVIVIVILLIPNERVNWWYGLTPDDTDPFDTGLYHELVEESFGGEITYQTDSIQNWEFEEGKLGTIAYIGSSPFPDSLHFLKLDSLVQAGHTIVAYEPSCWDLNKFWHISTGRVAEYFDEDTTAEYTNFNDRELFNEMTCDELYSETFSIELGAKHIKTGSTSIWVQAVKNDSTTQIDQSAMYQTKNTYITEKKLDVLFDEWEPISIMEYSNLSGSNYNWQVYEYGEIPTYEDRILAFRIPRGKGLYEIHLNAGHFTNYCLSNTDNFQYISDATSELKRDFYWFDYARYYDYGDRNGPDIGASDLSFILSYRSFRWAWYLLLASLLLFMAFRVQRRQRVMPVLNSPKNQSLEFAKSLGILKSKSKEANASLVRDIEQQFRAWGKQRFRRNIKIDEKFRDQLISMLPDNKLEIEMLFYIFGKAQRIPEEVTAEDLNSIYSTTRYIYQHV